MLESDLENTKISIKYLYVNASKLKISIAYRWYDFSSTMQLKQSFRYHVFFSPNYTIGLLEL